MKPNHTIVSYFAGGGGASLGAIAGGCTNSVGVELDNNIADLYHANIGCCITADVTQFDPHTIFQYAPTPEERRKGGHLIWQLSPPCQEFSRANKNRNQQSIRANVLKEIFWHEQVIRPDFIVLENVIDYQNYQGYQDFCIYLRDKGYALSDYILNAADFGVPQSRERLIMIAARKGLGLPTINKTHSKNPQAGQLSLFEDAPKMLWIGWYEAIKDLLAMLPKSRLTDKQKEAIVAKGWQTQLVNQPSFTSGCNAQAKIFLIDGQQKSVGGYRQIRSAEEPIWTIPSSCYKGKPRVFLLERVGYRNGLPKVSEMTEPCWTLRASLSDDQKGGTRTKLIDVMLDESDTRSLNTQALARLQSFPSSYQWSGKMALDVKVIGNSVCPLLMQRIVEAIFQA